MPAAPNRSTTQSRDAATASARLLEVRVVRDGDQAGSLGEAVHAPIRLVRGQTGDYRRMSDGVSQSQRGEGVVLGHGAQHDDRRVMSRQCNRAGFRPAIRQVYVSLVENQQAADTVDCFGQAFQVRPCDQRAGRVVGIAHEREGRPVGGDHFGRGGYVPRESLRASGGGQRGDVTARDADSAVVLAIGWGEQQG